MEKTYIYQGIENVNHEPYLQKNIKIISAKYQITEVLCHNSSNFSKHTEENKGLGKWEEEEWNKREQMYTRKKGKFAKQMTAYWRNLEKWRTISLINICEVFSKLERQKINIENEGNKDKIYKYGMTTKTYHSFSAKTINWINKK